MPSPANSCRLQGRDRSHGPLGPWLLFCFEVLRTSPRGLHRSRAPAASLRYAASKCSALRPAGCTGHAHQLLRSATQPQSAPHFAPRAAPVTRTSCFAPLRSLKVLRTSPRGLHRSRAPAASLRYAASKCSALRPAGCTGHAPLGNGRAIGGGGSSFLG